MSALAQFVDRHTMVYVRTYPHPIERVWEAVSQGEHLSVWLLPVTRVEQRAGGTATFTWGGPEEDGVETYVVSEYDPPRTITFSAEGLPTYMRFALEPDGDESTVLRFTLHWPVPDGVTFESEQWPGGDLPAGTDTLWRPGALAGFHSMLDQLELFLAGTWTQTDIDAQIAAATASESPPEAHQRFIDAYRAHVAERCPPA
jgi:uncharacterized protein YndB with AHSA1/START domain